MNTSFAKQSSAFTGNYVLFWTNLSRLNSLLVILNISMFFMTGLVNQGYYYTFYSLVGVYFLVASVVYWIRHGV